MGMRRQFAAVGQRGGAALHLMRLRGSRRAFCACCRQRAGRRASAHPRAPFVVVGLADNRLGLLPGGSRRAASSGGGGQARRAQYDAEVAAAEPRRRPRRRRRRRREAGARPWSARRDAEARRRGAAWGAPRRGGGGGGGKSSSEYEARARSGSGRRAPRPALHRAEAGAQNRGAAGPAEARRRIDDFFGPAAQPGREQGRMPVKLEEIDRLPALSDARSVKPASTRETLSNVARSRIAPALDRGIVKR